MKSQGRVIFLNINNVFLVHMHYKINGNHEWIENPRPYRTYWVTLLECSGERIPKATESINTEQLSPVQDMFDLGDATFKPNISCEKKLMGIKPIPPKKYEKRYRPEANIIVNNTENIVETVTEKEILYDEKKVEAFEKIINSKFKDFGSNDI